MTGRALTVHTVMHSESSQTGARFPLYTAAKPMSDLLPQRMRNRLPTIWACLLGFAPLAWLPIGTLQAAEDFSVEAQRNADLIEVRARATIEAPLAVVWGTLTDYEKLPEFVPGMKRSRIIARRGATSTVEQSGEARFLFFTHPIEITVESTERPPYIEVRRVSGNVRHLEGRYETEVLDGGRRVLLRWNGAIAPDISLPPLIGEVLMRMSIEDQFGGMVREIERREALRRQRQAPREPAAR